MADVPAIGPSGEKLWVDESEVGQLVAAGGRVEGTARRRELEAKYAQTSLPRKIGGLALQAGAGSILRNIPAVEEALPLPPSLEIAAHGVRSGVSGGLAPGITYQALKQVDPAAAKAYQEKEEALRQDAAYSAGEFAGMLGGALVGPGAGAGRLLPSALVSRLGGAVEGAVAKRLGAMAGEGALARAGVSAASLGAQGATEAALQGAGHEYGEQILGDHDTNAEKIFAAAGTGALYGGAGGALLGGAGSLAKSGVTAVAGAARSGLARVLGTAKEAVGEGAARAEYQLAESARAKAPGEFAAPREAPQSFKFDPDAGLKGAVKEEAFKPFQIEGDSMAGYNPKARLNPKMLEGAEIGEAPIRIVPEQAITREQIGGLKAAMGEARSTGAHGIADDLAWKALGTTRRISDKIEAEVAGGTRAVGNYVNRRILPKVGEETMAEGLVNAAMKGRADQLAPLIEADRVRIGQEIGDLVKAHDVPVQLKDITDRAGQMARDLAKSSATIDASEVLTRRVDKMLEAFQNRGAIASNGTVPLSAVYYERAALEQAAHEAGRMGQSSAKQAIKEWLRDVDTMMVQKLDEAAKAAGQGGAGEKLVALKREYQLSKAALQAAEDGADRIAGNNIFGLREGIGGLVGLATGHPITGLAAAVGGKIMRERGAAAGAYLMTRLADTGAIAKAVRAVDDQIGRSAKGVLLPPAKGGALPSAEPVSVRANRVIQAVRSAERDPEGTMSRVQQQTQALSGVAPKTAEAYAGTVSRAMGYLSQQIPPPPTNTNPFRADTGPRLTPMQQARIARLGEYVEQPLKFFADVERGLVTPEGVEMAKLLMPKSFEQLQVRTLEAIAEAKARGKQIALDERMRISMILDIQGDASLRPGLAKLLQENVSVPPVDEAGPSPGEAPSRRPVNLDTQPRPLDRIESR